MFSQKRFILSLLFHNIVFFCLVLLYFGWFISSSMSETQRVTKIAFLSAEHLRSKHKIQKSIEHVWQINVHSDPETSSKTREHTVSGCSLCTWTSVPHSIISHSSCVQKTKVLCSASQYYHLNTFQMSQTICTILFLFCQQDRLFLYLEGTCSEGQRLTMRQHGEHTILYPLHSACLHGSLCVHVCVFFVPACVSFQTISFFFAIQYLLQSDPTQF